MKTRDQENYQALCAMIAGRGDVSSLDQFEGSRWEALVQLARSEGVAPLLYDHLLKDKVVVPEECLEFLRADLHHSAAQNSLLFFELSRVLRAFHEADIPTVVLKGADLAHTLYSNPALRPMGDIDVLIPEGRLEQAIRIVEDMGFRPEQAWAAPELRTGLRRLFFFEANFDGGMDAKVHLELHWSLVAPRGNRYSPDIRWFWDGTRGASLAGQTALVLTATRNVLFLAAHLTLKHLAFKHGDDRTRLLWFHDLHWVIEQEGEAIDWEEMLGQAVRFGWQIALLLALKGTQERFGTQLPQGLLERLERQADRKLMRRLEAGESERSKTRFALSLEDFEHMRWSTRWWALWCLAFPEKKYMLWRYDPNPPWLWPLWYFYRWFDILMDGAKTVFCRKTVAP